MKRLFLTSLFLALAIPGVAVQAQVLQAIVGSKSGVPLPAPILEINLAGCTTAATGCAPTGSSVAYDQTGGGHNGTWGGTACGTSSWYSAATDALPYAGCFDGSTTYVTGNAMPTLSTTFSVVAWVNSSVATQSAYTRIIETFYGGEFYLGTDSTGTHYQWIVNDISIGSCIGGAVAPGSWQFVIGTYDGTSGNLYVNGSLVSGPVAFSAPSSYSGSWWIGRYAPAAAGGGYWHGLLNYVQIYNVALTGAQVNAMEAVEVELIDPHPFARPMPEIALAHPNRDLEWLDGRLAGAEWNRG